MKAIILAAGEGTRLKPLTNTIPKPLIKVCGKSILEYSLEAIYKYVNEIIIVVKYLKEKIIEEIGDNYKGTKVTYHEQKNKKGTGAALMGINCNEDIFILYGDGILDKKDIEKVIKSKYYGCLVTEVDNPEKYGIYKQDKDGFGIKIIEKPSKYIGNLANLGGFKFSKEIFIYIENIKESERGEYELPCAINKFLENNKFKLHKIEGEFIDIGTPEDLEIAPKKILKKPNIGETILLGEYDSYKLYLGIDKDLINSLLNYSQDETDTELLNNTGDKKRFASLEKIRNWYNDEDRYVFTLVDEKGALAGIWWGRPSNIPGIQKIISNDLYQEIVRNKDNIHTSGIRIYPDFRGKGLAKILLKSENYYSYIFPNEYMSIDIESDNIPSQKSYEKQGYIYFAKGQNDNSSKRQSGEKERMLFVKKLTL